jgi:hypothetical protein
MAVLIGSTCRPTKRTLKRKAVNEAKFSPHHNSGSWFSCLLNNEITISETKMLSVATKQEWEYPLFKPVSFLIWATIHKQIFLPWVSMKITEEQDISTFKSLSHHHFDWVIFRIHFWAWGNPLTIQVLSWKRASIVSYYYSIWIEHGYNFKHKIVS